ncbi:hypothetical protein GCM10017668_36610 [Streptomyces tuirus]|uniref:Uncharacterized protein n=1 Tax=Streptomyces tuirus TaxID=68278 RepID=A0A7G1NF90_9ACTN|nr:hypothetical protein GCM10017668_36610 [Streptomyces tuirus]
MSVAAHSRSDALFVETVAARFPGRREGGVTWGEWCLSAFTTPPVTASLIPTAPPERFLSNRRVIPDA